MKNPVTNRNCDDFNEFTEMLREQCKNGGFVRVKLRNGDETNIKLNFGQGLVRSYDFFCSEDLGRMMIWENDGTSITSYQYDMMETVD